MSNYHTSSGGGRPLPMTVNNVGFLLDRLGEDCSPLQYLRELTQNGKEAIVRANQPGEIIWDVDWISYDLGDVMKLCVIDTGDGMTGEEMVKFINQLSSSGAEQSLTANYGIGAKIAAATKNPKGVIYQSWKHGEGFMIELRKDLETGEYGLRQWELNDGSFAHFVPLEPEVKPPEIKENGTKVILLGAEDDDDTMAPPPGAPSPSRWISKYLNTRYYLFPEKITVKSREGWDFPRSDTDRNILRSITGQKHYLDQHALEHGNHDLTNAKVHWWILKDEKAITSNSGYIESAGHTAALYQDELYDRATARSATARLQQFGILFGARFVVIYLQPMPQEDSVLTTNTARTTLLLNGETLPWADWAFEFRENMPKVLEDFVKEKASFASDKDHLKTIKDRLKSIMDLYKLSRYRPNPQGVYLSDTTTSVQVGPSESSGRKSSGGGGMGGSLGSTAKGARDGEVGNIYHLFEKKDGKSSDKTQADPFPLVNWVSITDGSRNEDDMEDRAAKYLADQNTLMVNADFRVFTDMISRLCKETDRGTDVSIEGVVKDIVHGWFEQALIEAVIGVKQLKGSKEWGPNAIEAALSQEALTTAVMQRYHVHIQCRREIGAKLGKAIKAAAEEAA